MPGFQYKEIPFQSRKVGEQLGLFVPIKRHIDLLANIPMQIDWQKVPGVGRPTFVEISDCDVIYSLEEVYGSPVWLPLAALCGQAVTGDERVDWSSNP